MNIEVARPYRSLDWETGLVVTAFHYKATAITGETCIFLTRKAADWWLFLIAERVGCEQARAGREQEDHDT